MPTPKPPPAELVQEELSRLVDSDTLRRAPSHTRLLRYLVERRVAGDDTAFREKSIAFAVFRRDPATYDPQADPIVRVTARRLRERLESHYAGFDRPPKVRIVLPKGRYEPEFVASVRGAGRQGVAVTRMRNATGDGRHDALCAVFADRLTDDLARLGIPRVIGRDSVDQADAKGATPPEVAKRLGIEWVVESRLAAEPDGTLRATARLLDGTDAAVQWVETRTQDHHHRFVLLDVLADRVLARFAARLHGEEFASPARGLAALAVEERDALDAAAMCIRERSSAGMDRTLPPVEAVAAAHPECAEAWGTVALLRFTRAAMMDRDFTDAYDAARTAAERALFLDDERPEAALVLATIAGIRDLDWQPATARLRALLARYPHLTQARSSLASLLLYVGAFDQALEQIAVGRAHDPLSVLLRMNDANIRAYARRHGESRRGWAALRHAGVAPLWTRVLSGNNELWDGNLDAAAALYAQASALDPDNPTPWMCASFVHARRDDRRRARAAETACLVRFPQTSAYQRAMLSGALRDKPGVLERLHEARARHDPLVMSACVDPSFDWLGSDAQFDAMLQNWGLPGWRGPARPASHA